MAVAPKEILDLLTTLNTSIQNSRPDVDETIQHLKSKLDHHKIPGLKDAVLALMEAMQLRAANKQGKAYDAGQHCLDTLMEYGIKGELLGVTWNMMGMISASRGQHERAIRCYELGLKSSEVSIGLELVILQNLGTAHKNSGQVTLALETFNTALTKAEQHELPGIAAGLSLSIASVNFADTNALGCKEYLDRCLELNTKAPNPHLENYLHLNRSYMLRNFGFIAESRSSVEHLIKVFDTTGHEVLRIGIVCQTLLYGMITLDNDMFVRGMEMAESVVDSTLENNATWHNTLVEIIGSFASFRDAQECEDLLQVVTSKLKISMALRPKLWMATTLLVAYMRSGNVAMAKDTLHDVTSLTIKAEMGFYTRSIVEFCQIVINADLNKQEDTEKAITELIARAHGRAGDGLVWHLTILALQMTNRGITLNSSILERTIREAYESGAYVIPAIAWNFEQSRPLVQKIAPNHDWSDAFELLTKNETTLFHLARRIVDNIVV